MAGLKLIRSGSALPAKSVPNAQFEKTLCTSDEWIRSRTGIESRHIAENETTADLACKAVSNMIEGLKDPGVLHTLRYIVCATLSADDRTPSCACRVQAMLSDQYQIGQSACAFDLNGACSGFLMACQCAEGLLNSGESAIVIGAERISSFLDWNDRSTCVLFGDGAGAVLVRKDPNAKSLFYSRTMPDVHEVLQASSDGYLRMKGAGVYRFAIGALEEVYSHLQKQAAKSGLKPEADLVIAHQANLRILQAAAARLNLDFEKFFVNLQHTGNTSAASIPIALDEAARTGRLKPGMNIVLAGFGAGLSMAGAWLQDALDPAFFDQDITEITAAKAARKESER